MSSDVVATERISQMLLFAPLFSKRIWQRVLELVMGAILAPGNGECAILRVMGLHEQPHLLLSRAVWSSRKASQILLRHLIVVFAPTGVLVMGLDDTIERRRGRNCRQDLSWFAPVTTWLKPVVCGG